MTSLSGFDEEWRVVHTLVVIFAPAVPSWGYLDPQILFSNSHVPPQMVVLGHFPCNCRPCLPQMLDLALKEENESAKTSPSE